MNFKTSGIYFSGMIALCALAFLSPASIHAEDSEAEKEAEEAKAEAQKAVDDDTEQETGLKGKVAVNALESDGSIPIIVGTFQGVLTSSGEKGQPCSVLLKLTDPKRQYATLVKVGVKEVQLRGFFRNAKKYMLVSDVDLDAQIPPAPQEGR